MTPTPESSEEQQQYELDKLLFQAGRITEDNDGVIGCTECCSKLAMDVKYLIHESTCTFNLKNKPNAYYRYE